MLMDIGLLVILWASRRKTLASLSGHLSQKTPARQRVPAMMYIKNIVIGAGLSCVLLSAPILVHAANVVETKTFKNSVPGGNAATDIKITSNRHPFAARSDKFDFGNIDGNDITIRGGSLAQGASTTVTISYAGNDKVVKEKASFSFPTGPDVPITTPVVGEFGGQIPAGSGFTGFLELTNEGNSPLLFTNFRVAVDVPSIFFSDISSDAALALLTDNNLFIIQGTPVLVPTSFALAAGEGRRFDLGPVTETGYISSFFDVFFDLPLPEITTFGVAVQGVVPETETYAMLLAGLGLMGFVARRRQQKAA
jgi:PEP-CTERM motif